MAKFKLPSPQTTNFWVALGYGFAIAAVCAVIIGVGTFAYLSEVKWASFEYWGSSSVSGSEDFKTVPRSTVFRDVGGTALAVIGLILLTWRSIVFHRQLKLSERGHNAERFQKAAEKLGHQKPSVREAGVHSLTQLAMIDPDEFYEGTQKLLCTFIREQSWERYREEELSKRVAEKEAIQPLEETEELPGKFHPLHSELWEALQSIAILKTELDPNMERIDFLQVSDALFEHLNFENTDFSHFVLEGTLFQHTNLEYSKFDDANLENTKFPEANLEGCTFKNAEMTGARIEPKWQELFSDEQRAQIRWINENGFEIPFIPDPA
ncbi:Pentapeptide repeat-containing protein [Pseudovibrio ascidiaceicola]|uniref:Pentapeptide repeat-containing protein n=1 Tax=Pseudovibrio ascidiaceicola TaxID=285279 RepID=A0A1I4E0I6_9HYPH|nr:pentapeptide repeat-containing protein [Pseudovibrio ascidiaceicola]SFK98729.1 Pentapeptide repeat-containing protein [Pseudovibrio ascidiaceicola]